MVLGVTGNEVEYFCLGCGQLRLWAKEEKFKECGNCGYALCVVGKPGQLDRVELKKKYALLNKS